jgi:aspartyl protease family protein
LSTLATRAKLAESFEALDVHDPQEPRPNSAADTTGPGRTMLLVAWVGALALLTWLFGGLLQERFNPNGEPSPQWDGEGVAEVVLDANARGHYVVDGRINGRPVTLLVDTGATDVALSEALATRLALPRQGGVIAQTANGAVAGWRSQLDSLRIGALHLQSVPATVLPGLDDDTVLLGMSALKRLELVQRERQLRLRMPAS